MHRNMSSFPRSSKHPEEFPHVYRLCSWRNRGINRFLPCLCAKIWEKDGKICGTQHILRFWKMRWRHMETLDV